MSWHLVKTIRGKELKAKANLENQGFETYLPLVEVEKIAKDGERTSTTEPVFESYIFIQFDPNVLSSSLVRYSKGVSNQGIVRFGEQMTSIPWYVIENMKKIHDRLKVSMAPKPGDKVIITSGPLKDMEAMFTHPVGSKRSKILLSLLNQQQLLIIDNKSITTCR